MAMRPAVNMTEEIKDRIFKILMLMAKAESIKAVERGKRLKRQRMRSYISLVELLIQLVLNPSS